MTRELKVKMLVDYMATNFGTVDDEYDEIEDGLKRLYPEAKLSFERQVFMHKLRKEDYDIFVFDWGGLLPGAEDLTRSIYRSLLAETRKYEKDRLYILWSSFTESYFKEAAEEEFPEFISPNVVFSQDKNYEERCRLFFGYTPEAPRVDDGKDYQLISPPRRPPIGSSVFCEVDNALCGIIKEEAAGRTIVDCGAGQGLLGNKLKGVISIDILRQTNPNVIQADCTKYPFGKHTIPVFIRPCHSGFVEETLIMNHTKIKSALYVGLLKNVDADLGVFSKLAIIIHEEWTGSDGEKIWRIPLEGGNSQ